MTVSNKPSQNHIDTATLANLRNLTKSSINKQIANGNIRAVSVSSPLGGGASGTSYLIPITELTIEERIRYYEQVENPDVPINFDLSAYRMRFKSEAEADDAINVLFQRQQAVLAVLGIRRTCNGSITKEIDAVATKYGTTVRTLYRWEEDYLENGLTGLARQRRADKGVSRTMCAEAERFICQHYFTTDIEELRVQSKGKRTQAAVYDLLVGYAAQQGKTCCENCPNRIGTEAREALADWDVTIWDGKTPLDLHPVCTEAGQGIRIPNNRYGVNKYLKGLPPELITYYRQGQMAWKKAHMLKGQRTKPTMVNEAWFGDHHLLDVFVLDERGKAVRPWLTVWYDAASGVVVGYVLSLNPNSETIMMAFARGVAHKPDSIVEGLASSLYVDNGKDYRSARFEGEYDLPENQIGQAHLDITNQNILKSLRVEVTHAKEYQAWAKPVERWFKTLEERYMCELPGYCGGSSDEREENFDRTAAKLAERGALMTMDELFAHLTDVVLPTYHNTPHEGYKGFTPMEMYQKLPKARPERPDWQTLSAFMAEMVERKVTPQGVKFKNRLYWSPQMMHMSGQYIRIRYCRDDLSSVTAYTMDGVYIDELPLKEYLKMIGEDKEKLQRHIAMQKTQERELRAYGQMLGIKRQPGKRASGSVYTQAIDEEAPAQNMPTLLEAHKAAKGKRAAKAEAARRKKQENENDAVRRFFRRNGDALLKEHNL